jgi:hypothetical protein
MFLQVPEKFRVIVEDLVRRRAALEGAKGVSFPCSFPACLLTVRKTQRNRLDEADLSARVLNYTREVAAFLRCSRRMGLKHKPKTMVEVMLLQHEQRERQIKALEGIEDVLRLRVCCSSFLSLQFLV